MFVSLFCCFAAMLVEVVMVASAIARESSEPNRVVAGLESASPDSGIPNRFQDTLPKDPRLFYNHGAELAGSGKFDEAVEVLRHVAVARDRAIAAKALSLLGQISASFARQHISESPVETPPEQRQAIFTHLQSAEQSFAESLTLQSNEEVRQYLETVRAWRYNMTNGWEEYDRKQRRNDELQQRIQWLANWEEKLLERVRPLLEEPDSPRKFQEEYETSDEQKHLAEELALLQKTPIDDEELKEQWELLPEIQKIADEAAELLAHHRTEEALPKQQQVLDYLRSLLKQEQNQNQEQQDQDQQGEDQQGEDQQGEDQQNQHNQDQQNQDPSQQQEQQSDGESNEHTEQNQTSGMNPPPTAQQNAANPQEESPEERAERLLMQVRRKEQAAREQREQFRALLMQAEPAVKDW